MLHLFLKLFAAGTLFMGGKSTLVCLDEEDDPEDEADPLFSTNLELIKFPPNLPPPPPPPPPCCNSGVADVLGS